MNGSKNSIMSKKGTFVLTVRGPIWKIWSLESNHGYALASIVFFVWPWWHQTANIRPSDSRCWNRRSGWWLTLLIKKKWKWQNDLWASAAAVLYRGTLACCAGFLPRLSRDDEFVWPRFFIRFPISLCSYTGAESRTWVVKHTSLECRHTSDYTITKTILAIIVSLSCKCIRCGRHLFSAPMTRFKLEVPSLF